MEGTVNWAKREEGRPAFAGDVAAAEETVEPAALSSTGVGAAGSFDLGVAVVGIGLADGEETGMDGGLTGARGLETVGGVDFSAVLALDTAGFASGFLGATTALAIGTEDPLGWDFAMTWGAALAATLPGFLAMVTVLDVALPGVFSGGLALAVFTALAFSGPLDFAVASDLALATAVLLSFPDVVFTSCLLAERSCAVSVGPSDPLRLLVGFFTVGSPARECTVFPTGKPISCKIETIIWFSIRNKHFKKRCSPNGC